MATLELREGMAVDSATGGSQPNTGRMSSLSHQNEKRLERALSPVIELDCVLFMQNTKQTWGTSWLYRDSGPC